MIRLTVPLSSALLLACGATSGASPTDAPGVESVGAASAGASRHPAMRYIQDGSPLGVLGADGRVTLGGGEHVATVHPNGQVVDHEGARVLAITSSGSVVFSSVGREPMSLVDGALEFEPGAVLSIDETGNFRMGEAVVGIFVEGYRPDAAREAFLGWLALQFATIPWRRSLTVEARESLEAMYELLAAYVEEHHRLIEAAPATPTASPCGEPAAWPEGAPAPFRQLGFAPGDPLYYAYAIEISGSAFVLRARGDLDCDGVFGRFELHGQLADGALTREPLLRVIDELE